MNGKHIYSLAGFCPHRAYQYQQRSKVLSQFPNVLSLIYHIELMKAIFICGVSIIVLKYMYIFYRRKERVKFCNSSLFKTKVGKHGTGHKSVWVIHMSGNFRNFNLGYGGESSSSNLRTLWNSDGRHA